MLGAQSRGRSRSWDVSEAETRLAAARERHRGHRVAVGAPGSAAKPGHRRPPEGSGGRRSFRPVVWGQPRPPPTERAGLRGGRI